ncbi:hypothetical protein [Jiella avicenniae]|uniref:Uncharacterized protein n=1 Tax=Jiella avicenniae TaxID=2907202 RepID=A0A9X1P3Z7_9HYPH|nr:hypothetical protein [Jiella avicenniae]MCE7030967.1 hypothetical protein [Jiella avicenniae]
MAHPAVRLPHLDGPNFEDKTLTLLILFGCLILLMVGHVLVSAKLRKKMRTLEERVAALEGMSGNDQRQQLLLANMRAEIAQLKAERQN